MREPTPDLLQRRVLRLARQLRKLEERLDATTERLEQAVDITIRLTRLLAALNVRMKATHDRDAKRMDRLAESVMTGRTTDADRIGQLERLVAALERAAR